MPYVVGRRYPFSSLKFLFLTICMALSQSVTALEVGSHVPEISLPTSVGRLSLDQYRGKVVYLDFWASWCAPCRHSFPWMNAIQSKYGALGLKVIAVNLDTSSDDWKRFLAAVPANFEIAFDPKGDVPRQFDVKGMPTSRIVMQHVGFNDESRNDLENAIQSAVGSKP